MSTCSSRPRSRRSRGSVGGVIQCRRSLVHSVPRSFGGSPSRRQLRPKSSPRRDECGPASRAPLANASQSGRHYKVHHGQFNSNFGILAFAEELTAISPAGSRQAVVRFRQNRCGRRSLGRTTFRRLKPAPKGPDRRRSKRPSAAQNRQPSPGEPAVAGSSGPAGAKPEDPRPRKRIHTNRTERQDPPSVLSAHVAAWGDSCGEKCLAIFPVRRTMAKKGRRPKSV